MNIKPVPLYFLIALLITSCSETSLKDEAVNIFDANLSGENEEIEIGNNVIRSPDGLQFTKAEEDGNQSETVGLTSEGKVSFEGEMKNGKPHGEWTTFFPDGRPRWKGNKNEGVSHGPFTMWYQDGRKKMEGNYENGKKHGLSTMWHLNGSKWREQRHIQGEPSGYWRTWNQKGELIEEIDYETSN